MTDLHLVTLDRYLVVLAQSHRKAKVDTYVQHGKSCGWFVCPPGINQFIAFAGHSLTFAGAENDSGLHLSAYSQDCGGSTHLVAWAYTQAEGKASWHWFVGCLKATIEQRYHTRLHLGT